MKRVLLCAVLIAWSGICSAAVYKWVDAQGKTQYGDRPPDGVKAELVSMLGTHAPAPAPASHQPEAARANRAADTAHAQPDQDQAKKTVEEDVETARAKQCTEAQQRYKALIEGRHLYRVGKDGEREYLTDQEIDSERLNAKRDIDSICNSST